MMTIDSRGTSQRTQSDPSARFRELSSTEAELGPSQRKGSWVGAPTGLASLSYAGVADISRA